MIVAKGLKKRFGKVQVLDDVNFDIERGGVVAILGPNGSGKTTLLKILLGMVIPQKGSLCFLDKEVLGKWDYRRKIGYLPQIARFPDNLKVLELIKMIKDVRGIPANEQPLIERFGLETYLNKKLGNLSGGTRQKVNLVLTFMFDSPLLILDEPTAGLDPVSLIRLKGLIEEEKKKGKTLLITTHNMSLVDEIADEIVFLLEGKIYFKGAVGELKRKTKQNNLERAIANVLDR
jgi:Cu-processing system ATP-binding protein